MNATADDNFDNIVREMAESLTRQARRTVKGRYALATLGATTECGGVVASASSPVTCRGYSVACVGDIVRYPDGRETTIVSGAGSALSVDGKPMALVGSVTANGDMIVKSPQETSQIQEFADDPIPGLFEAGYRAPAGPPGAVMGRAQRS